MRSTGTQCRHGVFVYPPEDHYIGKALEIFGEYSELEVQFLCSLVRPGDVVVEVGAHIGAITVPLANKVGSAGCVYAFEPQADLFALLAQNVEFNKLRHVHICATALGAGIGMARYTQNKYNTGAVELGSTGDYSVNVGALDEHQMTEAVNLMKIDVEGMEREVLQGARATILKHRPLIYLENDRPLNSLALLDELFALGYRVWRHEPWLFNQDNFRKVAEDGYPGVVTQNVLAVPAEKDPPEQVKNLKEILPNQWAAVCRFGGVGDNLIAAAVLSGLTRQGNRVEVITNEHAGCVFENNPYVAKLSICKDGDQPKDGGKEWQGWFEKRSHEYKGGLYHLSHSVECSLAFVQAQTQFWWRPEVRRMMAYKSYIELAADICGSGYDFGPLFYPTGVELAKAAMTKDKIGKRVVGWVLCGSRFDKIYPYSAWAIARIIKECGVSVMMIGKPGQDYEIAKAIQRDVEKQNGSLDGLHLALTVEASKDGPKADWPLRRSLTQLLLCDLVIAPDTGSAWACAFHKVPKIVLLSHASDVNITKHWVNVLPLHADPVRVPCWPCHRLHDTHDTCVLNKDKTGVACISDISVETIVANAREVLRGTAS